MLTSMGRATGPERTMKEFYNHPWPLLKKEGIKGWLLYFLFQHLNMISKFFHVNPHPALLKGLDNEA